MQKYINLFTTGVILSWGPCFAFCGGIAIPYLASTQRGVLGGIKAVLAFSFSRLFSYLILSLIFGGLTKFLIGNYYESRVSFFIYPLMSIFVFFSGIMILIGKSIFSHKGICRLVSKRIDSQSIKAISILGILTGLLPCLPLLSVLTYIAFNSKNLLDNLFLGLSFGLGTVFSPLIIFGPLATKISSFLSRRPQIYRIFNLACGLILIYLSLDMGRKIFI